MTRPSGERWSSPGTVAATHARSVTSKAAPSRLEATSSGPNSRNVCGLALITSRIHGPSTPVAPAIGVPGSGTSTP